MLGHIGFSYIGFLWLLMLMVPNLIWAKHQPEGYDASRENKVLLMFERIGQVCVTCTVLIFSDFNLKPFSAWSLWLVASFVLMIMYECYWICYFKSDKTLKDFYSSFLGVPLAGATLPVAAFLLLAIYGKVIWLFVSGIILAIGHIGIHWQHLKELHRRNNRNSMISRV